ncbi:hypothetical protein AVEN_49692-1, partial [Araneus ventricosus]
MRSRRINKRVLACLVGIVMVWVQITFSAMTRSTSFGQGWVVAGNWLLGLPPAFPTAVMAPVIQTPWYASWHAR